MDGARDDRAAARGRSGLSRVVLVLGAIALALALIVVGVGFGAERIVNKQKDIALTELSKQLGRPVTAGPLRLALLRGRVEVRDIVVGRDPAIPEEPDPTFRLDRAYVAVALGPAIRSLGKRVEVQSILVERPLVQVSRDKDGRLNWQRIAEKLDTGEPPKPIRADGCRHPRAGQGHRRSAACASTTPGSASWIWSRAQGGGRRDRRPRRGPERRLAGGALRGPDLGGRAGGRARTSTCGRGSPPRPPRAAGPAAGAAAGAADDQARAGAAGAAGPLRRRGGGGRPRGAGRGQAVDGLRGGPGRRRPGRQGTHHGARVRGAGVDLKFAGGEAFDARLDTDVGGNLDQGTLDITGVQAQLGNMGLRAQGRLAELTGAPRVEKLTVESEGLDFTRLRGYYPPLDRTAGAELRGPFSVQAQAQGSAEEQKLTARLDFDGGVGHRARAAAQTGRHAAAPRAAGHRRARAGAGRAAGADACQGGDDRGGDRCAPRATGPRRPADLRGEPGRPDLCRARAGRPWWPPRRPPGCPTCGWPSRPGPAARWAGRRA